MVEHPLRVSDYRSGRLFSPLQLCGAASAPCGFRLAVVASRAPGGLREGTRVSRRSFLSSRADGAFRAPHVSCKSVFCVVDILGFTLALVLFGCAAAGNGGACFCLRLRRGGPVQRRTGFLAGVGDRSARRVVFPKEADASGLARRGSNLGGRERGAGGLSTLDQPAPGAADRHPPTL